MTSSIEIMRKQIIDSVLSIETVSRAFPVWQPIIEDQILTKIKAPRLLDVDGTVAATAFLEVAKHLRDIFRSTGSSPDGESRGQDMLSGGGVAWEGIVCYYLNLMLVGSNSVVYKKGTMMPQPVRDALSVFYGNIKASTESDLVAVTFPEHDSLQLSEEIAAPKEAMKRLAAIADRNFHELTVGVIQCKTNWNDNAQVPMLWDMVYAAQHTKNVVVGCNNRSLSQLKYFSYAFATAPSNKLEVFKPTSLSVQRLAALTGGNYWGVEGQSGIAQDLSAYFAKARIGPDSGRAVRDSLGAELPNFSQCYGYFRLSL
ncbi:hypothetical protein [Luminiphilus sp. nBUS_07]|uniref:hypothetical protein n=1 Tax=Luminiphilus sp. nBUS_07 TaxID=3395314 RepID=UPI003EB973B0